MNPTNGSLLENGASTAPACATDGDVPASALTQTVLDDRILVTCPHCKTVLSVRRKYVGDAVRCKRCSRKFLLPAAVDNPPIPVYEGTPAVAPSDSPQSSVNSPNQRTGAASSGLLDHLAKFVSSYDELRSAHDQLQTEHIRAKTERNDVHEQLKHATDELNTIRAELGTIAPADVQSLVCEREALSVEVRRIQDESQASLAERARHENLIAQLEKRILELVPIGEEKDALAARVKAHEVELHTLRADRDAVAETFRGECAALLAANTELCQLREHLEQTQTDLSTARQEREQTSHQLELCKNDFASLQADLARLNSEQQNALETIGRLTNTIAERDQTVFSQRDRFDAELESTRGALSSAEETLGAERERLTTELASLGVRYDQLRQEHRSAEVLCANLQSRNAELGAAQVRLASEYQSALEVERTKQQQLAEEITQLRLDAEQAARAATELMSTAVNSPIKRLFSAEESEAAGITVKDGLDNSERVDRMTSDSLASMGIHQRWPKPRIGARPSN